MNLISYNIRGGWILSKRKRVNFMLTRVRWMCVLFKKLNYLVSMMLWQDPFGVAFRWIRRLVIYKEHREVWSYFGRKDP